MRELVGTIHINTELSYLAALIRERGNKGFLTSSGKSMSKAKALAIIREKRKAGYSYWPHCDNVDSRGRCQGHKAARPELRPRLDALRVSHDALLAAVKAALPAIRWGLTRYSGNTVQYLKCEAQLEAAIAAALPPEAR